MKQNRPSKPALFIHVLLTMVFAMGMFSSQPVVAAEAASIVPQSRAEDPISLSAIDLENPDPQGSADFVAGDISAPCFVVAPQYNVVEVYNWTPDSIVKLVVDGTLVAESTSNAEGRVTFGYEGPHFDISAGQLVKVTGGGIIMKHTVANLKIKSINTLTDTITGKAAPGSEVIVGIPGYPMGFSISKNVTTGADGIWLAEFSGLADIGPGESIGVKQFDGNGNATWMEWYTPDPKIYAYYAEDEISGWGWWPGSKVTLTVGSYTASITVNNRGTFVFALSGILDIQRWDEIVVSDGTLIKQLWVSDLTITTIDETADTVSGTADPGSTIEILAFEKDASSGYFKSAIANEDGIWTVNYSGVVEIGSGTHGWVEQADGDGDCTHLNYIIPDRPVVTSLSKPFLVAGQPSTKLIVNGSKFSPTSSIWWEENKVESTFISKNQLSMKVEPAYQTVAEIFYLRVVNQPGGIASSPIALQAIETRPVYNGKLTSNFVTFDWTDILGATGYKIQMSAKSDFSSLLVNTKTIESTYDGYTTPFPRGKTYYWRIQPYYGDVKGTWSVGLPFITRDPLAKPTQQYPASGEVITDDDTIILDWDPVVEGSAYLVQISKLSDFGTIYDKATVANTIYETQPLPNGKYYWRVRAIDDVGNKGPWSEVRMFKIALVP